MDIFIIDTLRYGLCYSLLALGIFLSYRVLDIADLTAEGSFTLGGASTAVLLVLGVNPFLATLIGMICGFIAGIITGIIHTKLKVPGLLSGIITMTALFAINMVIFGLAPTVTKDPTNGFMITQNTSGYASQITFKYNINFKEIESVFNSFLVFFDDYYINTIFVSLIFVVIIVYAIYLFFGTEIGMSIRATGINPNMSRAQGINTTIMIILGLGIGNALIAMSGSLLTQMDGTPNSQMGIGTLVVGLSSIIVGEAVFGKRTFKNWIISVAAGAILYYLIIEIAIYLNFPQHLLKLLCAILVLIALVLPQIKKLFRFKNGGGKNVNA